jgi:hypothetical protein
MSLKLITEILRQTPLWAWAILIAVLAVGFSQCRDRVVKPFTVMIAPLVFLVIGALASARAVNCRAQLSDSCRLALRCEHEQAALARQRDSAHEHDDDFSYQLRD